MTDVKLTQEERQIACGILGCEVESLVEEVEDAQAERIMLSILKNIPMPPLETFQRLTQLAALEASRAVGYNNKGLVDMLATRAMKKVLNNDLPTKVRTLYPEGLLDYLHLGEQAEDYYIPKGTLLGQYRDCPNVPVHADLLVDPVDGTSLAAKGRPGAIAVVALVEPGTTYDISSVDEAYFWKVVTDHDARDQAYAVLGEYHHDDPFHDVEFYKDIMRAVANAHNKRLEDLDIMILDRPNRHRIILDAAEALGVRLSTKDAGDLMPGITACLEGREYDLVLGAGGGPEAMITAAAVKCNDGCMIAQTDLALTNREMGKEVYDLSKYGEQPVLTLSKLISGKVFAVYVTAVTTDYLPGVRMESDGVAVMKTYYARNDGVTQGLTTEHRVVAPRKDGKVHNWYNLMLSEEELQGFRRAKP